MLKMVMTTELRQAIGLLQLSTYELFQFVEQQGEENPFIEFVENETVSPGMDSRPRKKAAHQQVDPLDFVRANEKTMHEDLLEQMTWFNLTEEQYRILNYLVLNINDQGFLTMKNEEICAQLGISQAACIEARQSLRWLEPAGIGARDVRECLWIQARQQFPEDVILHDMIEEHLQLLADKQWHRLAKLLEIPLMEVQAAFEKIQALNPRPAADLITTKIDYVTPDITIRHNKKTHGYEVLLNDYYIPNIQFNRGYSQELPKSKEVSAYVQEHFRKYEWLQKSIVQRRNTILKIMDVIICRQEDFLMNGFRSLRPLTLKDVADEIDMHESTVSRATANKIIQTPVGTFELKSLFSTKLATSSGNDTSQTTVKELIRDMIEKENKYKPLSDQKIADELKQHADIVISRRTVAKYRDELNILSSSKRKEIKIS